MNAFGEQTELLRTEQVPRSRCSRTGSGCSRGCELHRRLHRLRGVARLPRSGRRITAAGRDPGQPAFVALGLGGGIVLRAGTPQWARELDESALSVEVPIVTKRIWRMLSAGGTN